MVFHNAENFVTGIPLRKYKKSLFLCLSCRLHNPFPNVRKSNAPQPLWGVFLCSYLVGLCLALLERIFVYPYFSLWASPYLCYSEENTVLDISIKSRFRYVRIKYIVFMCTPSSAAICAGLTPTFCQASILSLSVKVRCLCLLIIKSLRLLTNPPLVWKGGFVSNLRPPA